MHIITGHGPEEHVTSQRDADSNMALFGPDDFVLPIGTQYACTVESNNLVLVHDGQHMMQGRKGAIDFGEVDYCQIETGMQEQYRSDIIVCRYTRDIATNIEAMESVVVTGAYDEGDPDIIDGTTVRDGAAIHDMPIYRVRVEGLSIMDVEPLFAVFYLKPCVFPFVVDASSWLSPNHFRIKHPSILPHGERTETHLTVGLLDEGIDGVPPATPAQRELYRKLGDWKEVACDPRAMTIEVSGQAPNIDPAHQLMGKVTQVTSVDDKKTVTRTVVFESAFANVPKVTITPVSMTAPRVSIVSNTVSKTQFKVKLRNDSGKTANIGNFNWSAVDKNYTGAAETIPLWVEVSRRAKG